MAGIAKPTDPLLGPEASYNWLSGSGGNNQDGKGLFDGTAVDGWNTNFVFYWNSTATFVEVDIISNEVNIWRSGTSTYPHYTGNLKIERWQGSSFVDVTPAYPQVVNNITNSSWHKTITKLPKGRYRFGFNSALRIDSEWFIEEIVPVISDLGKSIFKVSSGLIFNDLYNSLDARWTLSPVGSYSITDRAGFMKMKHHASLDTLMLADLPNVKEFAFEVFADYTPVADGDSGGIVVWKNSVEKTEFLEKLDVLNSEEQKAWKAVKEDDRWSFYSDAGLGYNFIDSEKIDSPMKFGVTLKRGSQPDFTDLDVDRIVATLGDKLTVRNVAIGYSVIIEDSSGNVITSGKADTVPGIVLKLPTLVIDGILKVVDDKGNVVNSVPTQLYGGDVYSLGTSLQIRNLGVELSTTSHTDLGSLSAADMEIKLEVFNPSTFNATSVKIAIEQYLAKFGWTWADIAPDVSGVPGTYAKSLNISTLPSATPYPFWLRITKGMDYMGMEPIQFNIHLEHA